MVAAILYPLIFLLTLYLLLVATFACMLMRMWPKRYVIRLSDGGSIHFRHSAGFFSCCSVRLAAIVEYFAATRTLPRIVDGSGLFGWYTPVSRAPGDITREYFECRRRRRRRDLATAPGPAPAQAPPSFDVQTQYARYGRDVDYEGLGYFVDLYFTPTPEIMDIAAKLVAKYGVSPRNTCVLFHRGNDKARETKIAPYGETVAQAARVSARCPGIRFLVQSDETEFIEYALPRLAPDSFQFEDEVRHMRRHDGTVDRASPEDNFKYSKYFLAITLVMSRCGHVICGSGNCPLWIMLYRGNAENVTQYVDGEWARS